MSTEADGGLLPRPEYVQRLQIGRYHCPYECGWYHDEPMDVPLRIILPADYTQQDIGDTLSLDAELRAEVRHQRIMDAWRAHQDADHAKGREDT